AASGAVKRVWQSPVEVPAPPCCRCGSRLVWVRMRPRSFSINSMVVVNSNGSAIDIEVLDTPLLPKQRPVVAEICPHALYSVMLKFLGKRMGNRQVKGG